ncbi:MAG: 4-hydroxy-3-methylbut-2-enyl diphosphate reductase [Puniceicoccaceae bacterium]|nr:4-hydroxy-3-methylbut-2-enyl diphosphate reductase [Puniceicoccaceae bacterium]|tara:strand:- start:513 stop:2180 length:1668 start_codon:yes stop_codon:yes gene_type:complete
MDPIRLLFNSSNHLLVTSSDDGSYTLAQVEPEGRNWHVLSELQSAKGRQSILCALVFEECNVTGEWYTIDRLGDLTLSGDLRQVLQAIDEQLYRIPYLGMGENEYIYRFRTTKERNRSVYIDGQSEALYQSALCLAIKEARRTKEKSSGEPAVLDFGAVSYVIPSHFGFCLGVQNAIERAYETVAQHPNRRVFMLSELIHNPFVNEDLLARGLRYLQTDKGLPLRADGSIATSADDPTTLWNQLTEEDIVIIPAFGATNEDKARLIRRGLSIRENDATCMLVEKVWKAARRYAQEGYTVLIHGKSEHEETKATFSNSSSHGPALMLRNMEHARRLAEVIQAETSEKKALFEASFAGLYSKGFDPLKDLERIAVVNQTTLLRNETLTIIEYLRDVIACKYGESEVAEHLWSKGKGDTLCYATQVNQDALHKAVEQSIDAALVVGGKNSSNTYQLYRVCSERFGEAAHYIQSEDNLRSLDSVRHYIFPYNLTAAPATVEEDRPLFKQVVDKPRILLTGGASCPDGIIQQVIHRINSFFPSNQIRPVQEILAAFRSDT